MKLIHFPQELLTLLIAFTVSTCAFANNHEETDPDWNWVHDFVVDNYAYDIIPSSSNSIPCVVLIEAHGHSGHIDIPAYVTHNDTTYQVSTLGVGGPVFRECRDLTSVYIPKEIMMINNNPFVGCSNLANISVDPENKYYDILEIDILLNEGENILTVDAYYQGTSSYNYCLCLQTYGNYYHQFFALK